MLKFMPLAGRPALRNFMYFLFNDGISRGDHHDHRDEAFDPSSDLHFLKHYPFSRNPLTLHNALGKHPD